MEPLDSLNRWSDRLRDRARAGTFFRFTWKRFLGDRLFEAAGALSFTTVFALVPLSMVVFGVLSAFPVFDVPRLGLVDSPVVRDDLLGGIDILLPERVDRAGDRDDHELAERS